MEAEANAPAGLDTLATKIAAVANLTDSLCAIMSALSGV